MEQISQQNSTVQPWKPREWILLLLLAAVQFIHILDFMIMMPLGPQYLREMNITTREFGILVSAYAFSACISGLVAAFIIDRYDRKQALLFLSIGFTLGTAICGINPGYTLLLVGRSVAGFFGGILGALVLAVVGDAFHESKRGLATGVIMSGFSVATILGVPAGLFLADWLGIWAPFASLAILAALVTILMVLVFPPMSRHLAGSAGIKQPSSWKVLLQPSHLWAYLLIVCLVIGMFTIVPFLATFMVFNVGLDSSGLKLMYFFGGLSTLLSLSLIGKLADRFGKLFIFRIMAILTVVAILVVTNLGPIPMIPAIATMAFLMVVTSGRMVPAMAMITSSAQPAYRGRFMAVISSVQQAASGLASLIAGLIISRPDPEGPLEGFPIAGILASMTTVASIVLASALKGSPAKSPSEKIIHPQDSLLASSPEAAMAGEAVMTGVTPQPESLK